MISLTGIVEDIIDRDIPRKYKRSAFIYTLLSSMDSNLTMSEQTLRKIERLFETGTITVKEAIIGKLIGKYLWNDIVKTTDVTLDGQVLSIDEAIEKYRVDEDMDNQMKYIISIVNALYASLPNYIRYGTEALMKKDIFSTITVMNLGAFKT